MAEKPPGKAGDFGRGSRKTPGTDEEEF